MLQLHQGNYEIVIIIPQEELQSQGISEATTLHINAWRDFLLRPNFACTSGNGFFFFASSKHEIHLKDYTLHPN